MTSEINKFGDPNCLHFGSRGEPKGVKLEAPEPCEKQVCFQEPPRGIRTLSNTGGGCHGRLEEVQGGGQQEGRQGSHTPVDPKGSADLGFVKALCRAVVASDGSKSSKNE